MAAPRKTRIDLVPDDDQVDIWVNAIEITEPKDVRLDQLDFEVTKNQGERGWTKPAGVTMSGDPTTASEDNPVYFYVERDSEIDVDRFLDSVVHHRPDPNWSDAAPGSNDLPTLEDVKARAAAGQTLSLVDLQVAVVSLLAVE
jgi:hypothetical protein